MSKRLVSRMLGMFQSRTQVGINKAGNRYFTRVEEVDSNVEWICWLNGQRKKAPTPEGYFHKSTTKALYALWIPVSTASSTLIKNSENCKLVC